MPSNPAILEQRIYTLSSQSYEDFLQRLLQSHTRSGDLSDLQSVLANLVTCGQLDRIAARAIMLIAQGKLDPADLRQLLPKYNNNIHKTEIDSCEIKDLDLIQKIKKIYNSTHVLVYRGYHKGLQSKVIIKLGISEYGCQQIMNERRILIKCCHPSIIRMWYAGTYEGKPFLMLERLHCSSWQWVMSYGAVSIGKAVKWMLDWARGLRQLNRYGWCHGDITPSNLLIRHKNQGVIADLGCAYPVSLKYCPNYTPIGATWAYAAPERFVGPGDQRSDMYSLALSIYSLLQRNPLIAENDYSTCLAAHRHLNLAPLHWIYPIPFAVSQLIKRMASPEPKERPNSWDEVIEVLYHSWHEYKRSLIMTESRDL